jgi:hypothetical protein
LPWIVDYVTLYPHVCKENNKWENVGYVLYSLHEYNEEKYNGEEVGKDSKNIPLETTRKDVTKGHH